MKQLAGGRATGFLKTSIRAQSSQVWPTDSKHERPVSSAIGANRKINRVTAVSLFAFRQGHFCIFPFCVRLSCCHHYFRNSLWKLELEPGVIWQHGCVKRCCSSTLWPQEGAVVTYMRLWDVDVNQMKWRNFIPDMFIYALFNRPGRQIFYFRLITMLNVSWQLFPSVRLFCFTLIYIYF